MAEFIYLLYLFIYSIRVKTDYTKRRLEFDICNTAVCVCVKMTIRFYSRPSCDDRGTHVNRFSVIIIHNQVTVQQLNDKKANSRQGVLADHYSVKQGEKLTAV